MIVAEILYSSKFVVELRKMPKALLVLVIKKESIFKDNPLHPSLRLHALHGKLQGLWSISITGSYRIINADWRLHFCRVLHGERRLERCG